MFSGLGRDKAWFDYIAQPDVGRDLSLVNNCGFRCGAHLVFTDALGAFNDFQTPFNHVKNTQIRDNPINDTFAG